MYHFNILNLIIKFTLVRVVNLIPKLFCNRVGLRFTGPETHVVRKIRKILVMTYFRRPLFFWTGKDRAATPLLFVKCFVTRPYVSNLISNNIIGVRRKSGRQNLFYRRQTLVKKSLDARNQYIFSLDAKSFIFRQHVDARRQTYKIPPKYEFIDT